MDMNREIWIDEVMGSLDDVKSAEANPFLYTRILGKLENTRKQIAPARLIWLAAASFLLLLALNIFVMKSVRNNSTASTGTSEIEILANGYGLTNNNTFSYN